MGVRRTSFLGCFILAVLGLIISAPILCRGGTTSSFVRKVEKTIDMPMDSDVFSVPPGYNAPQQVISISLRFSCLVLTQCF